MRKFIYIIIAGFLLGSCVGNKDNKNEDETEKLEFDNIVVDTVIGLTNDISSPKAEIHLNIQYVTNEKHQRLNDSILRSGILTPDYLALTSTKLSVEESIDTFVIQYLDDYKKDYGSLYARDREHGASYNLKYSCNTKIEEGYEGILNYIAEVYYYAGGAHGQNLTIVKNIDPKTGKLLKTYDFFAEGFEGKLTEILEEFLCKRFEVEDLKGLRKKGIFMSTQPYIPENVIVNKDNFEFIYCDTEIAPHAVGEIRVVLDRDKLKEIIK